jgi:hypothetical protein
MNKQDNHKKILESCQHLTVIQMLKLTILGCWPKLPIKRIHTHDYKLFIFKIIAHLTLDSQRGAYQVSHRRFHHHLGMLLDYLNLSCPEYHPRLLRQVYQHHLE